MKRTQLGSFSLAIVLLLIVGAAAFIWLVDDLETPAPLNSVDEVIALTQSSVATQTILKTELVRTPTPTISELRSIRRKIEEQLLLERSIELTGNKALEAASVAKARLAIQLQPESDASFKAMREATERSRRASAQETDLAFYAIGGLMLTVLETDFGFNAIAGLAFAVVAFCSYRACRRRLPDGLRLRFWRVERKAFKN